MEEVRAAAMAYYANMSKDQKQDVHDFYQSLDANGDGKVTCQEYLYALKEAGCNQNSLPSNLFEVLDKNNDGTLDLEECITFYYMIAGRRLVSCDGCGSYMLGLHFLCVECYCSKEKTYDLCCSCYRNNNFNHVHSFFLDNFALLRTELPAGAGRSCYKRNKGAEAFQTAASVVHAAKSVAKAANTAYDVYDVGSTAYDAYDVGSTAYDVGSTAYDAYDVGSTAVGVGSTIASLAGFCTIM